MTTALPDKTKMSDINPFGLRMPPDLKNAMEKEAQINGRSMNAEIVNRLRSSLDQTKARPSNSYQAAEVPPAAYVVNDDTERAMLAVFRRMSPEKQLALLSLFK